MQQRLGEGLTVEQGGAGVCGWLEREGGHRRHGSSGCYGELPLHEAGGQWFVQVLVLP